MALHHRIKQHANWMGREMRHSMENPARFNAEPFVQLAGAAGMAWLFGYELLINGLAKKDCSSIGGKLAANLAMLAKIPGYTCAPAPGPATQPQPQSPPGGNTACSAAACAAFNARLTNGAGGGFNGTVAQLFTAQFGSLDAAWKQWQIQNAPHNNGNGCAGC